jgi:hypothetical protein
MKTKLCLILIVGLGLSLATVCVYGAEPGSTSRVLSHAGKTFRATEDPEFISYDQALRVLVAKRIGEHFGVMVDSNAYSGFDLLEIETFLKCRKSGEPVDAFLKKFGKRR